MVWSKLCSSSYIPTVGFILHELQTLFQYFDCFLKLPNPLITRIRLINVIFYFSNFRSQSAKKALILSKDARRCPLSPVHNSVAKIGCFGCSFFIKARSAEITCCSKKKLCDM